MGRLDPIDRIAGVHGGWVGWDYLDGWDLSLGEPDGMGGWIGWMGSLDGTNGMNGWYGWVGWMASLVLLALVNDCVL
nr:hypothetical protein Q903MT_gene4933 [Picea sitchensis]